MDEEKKVCDICQKPFQTHPGNGRLTCMFHGNPQGSPFEQRIYQEWITRNGR